MPRRCARWQFQLMTDKLNSEKGDKMKIFITGATGYIGFAVAKTFRRAGYQVLGLTRSIEKSKLLAKEEIEPIIGSLQNPSGFVKTAAQSDIIIHAAVDYSNNTAALDKDMIESIIDAARVSGKVQKLIYTSGTWVYGKSQEILTEESETKAIKAVRWRPETDKLVIDNPYLNGIVIRPGCVYGGKGDMTNDLFDAVINKKSVDIIGDGTNRWPMVHVDDLARAYQLAAENNIVDQAINIVEELSSSINEIVSDINALINHEGKINPISLKEAIEIRGDFAEALAINQTFDTSKARALLGWKPLHRGFHQELNQYYSTWKAFQEN